jgi:hypothetical protein
VSFAVGWVQPPKYKKGLDPLGVQQPCISIYSELLPGLTNVTDRVIYYSFGPWFAWAFAKRHPQGKAAQFVEMLRRAEVLLTLIGSRHGLALNDGHFEEHGGSLVGVNTLRKVVEQTPKNRAIKLSDYALIDESPQRYFKNRRGGLGQYYLGALREEYHLLDDAKGGVIDFTIERGHPMAEAFDSGVDRDHFFKCIESDHVSAQSLDSLAIFCPCQLRSTSRATERALLCDTVLGDKPELSENSNARRYSLALIVDFLNSANGCEGSFISTDEFLTSCYSRVLPGKHLWSPPPTLLPTANLWSFYVRNEMLSIAMQRLFQEALEAIEAETPPLQSLEAAALWLASYNPFKEAIRTLRLKTFSNFIAELKGKLPALDDISNRNHEIALWDSSLEDTKSPSDGIVAAIKLIVTLLARPGALADDFEKATGSNALRMNYYPINIQSVSLRARNSWSPMSLEEWLADLLSWIMSTHRQVAFRKLAASGDDTRRLKMGDNGLYFDGDVIDVARTQPRLSQAFRFLHDLGLIARAKEERLPLPTTDGRLFLRRVVDAA